ncbi:MAG: 5-nitroimidazole antibiotic resistance protein [Eubacteriaceae bacterium]|nr:5-nitroimidazole antibiotic resistance protein [Eubacteriaceae bacterium]
MFRKMRRINQQLAEEENIRILEEGTYGVLSLVGEGGYPYAVPLNYLYRSGKIIFHCAQNGHKTDALAADDRACFCVVDKSEVIPEQYATHYSSVIAFGRIKTLEGEEKRQSALALAERFRPGHAAEAMGEINSYGEGLTVLEMTIEHMTGKQAKGLVGK